MFVEQCSQLNNAGSLWVVRLRRYLESIGFGYLWHVPYVPLNIFYVIRQRVHDIYIQDWNAAVHASPKLEYYRKFKTNFEFESYLVNIRNDKLRKQLTRFRISGHTLAIETGRYLSVNRENRICNFCPLNTVESEYHFLLLYPNYRNIRNSVSELYMAYCY